MAIITNLNSRNLKRALMLILTCATFAISASAYGTFPGDRSGERVVSAETMLVNLGYWITRVDNKSDDSTRQAILAFQKVNGLKRTGVLDDLMLAFARQHASDFRFDGTIEMLLPPHEGADALN